MSFAGLAGVAQAQGGKLGVYAGTVAISGIETGKTSKVTFRANVKIAMPLTSGNARSAVAEIDDVDKPSATATRMKGRYLPTDLEWDFKLTR